MVVTTVRAKLNCSEHGGVRTTPRGNFTRISAFIAVLVTSAFASLVRAQDKPAPASDQAKSAAHDKADSSLAAQDSVIRERSIFFPDLANSRTPLSVKQKFHLFVKNSLAPATVLGSAFGAGVGQATDSPSGYGQGAEGYGKRFGASLATGASSSFFGGFIITSIARQDPRFFIHGEGTFRERLGHAITRVVVAPRDRGGYGFNWGGVFGPLGAEALANTYLPAQEQTGARTMSRYGMGLATGAGLNILKEFWPDIFKRLGLQK